MYGDAFPNQEGRCEHFGDIAQVIHSVMFLFSQVQTLDIIHSTNVVMLMLISELSFLNFHKHAINLFI